MSIHELQVRFRHANGDLGPYSFQDTQLLSEVKEKLVAEWPKGTSDIASVPRTDPVAHYSDCSCMHRRGSACPGDTAAGVRHQAHPVREVVREHKSIER